MISKLRPVLERVEMLPNSEYLIPSASCIGKSQRGFFGGSACPACPHLVCALSGQPAYVLTGPVKGGGTPSVGVLGCRPVG